MAPTEKEIRKPASTGKTLRTGWESIFNPEGTNLVYPVAIGAGVLVLVSAVAFAGNDIPGPGQLALVLSGVENFLTESGWPLLGLSTALLAAAFTALSIIGYRGNAVLSPIKLNTMRATIQGFIFWSVALASLVATGYVLAVSSPGRTRENAPILGSSTDMASGAVSDVQQDATLMVLGLSALAIIMSSEQLGKAVTIWFRTDLEVHEAERKLLIRKIAVRRLLIYRALQQTRGDSFLLAICRSSLLGILLVLASFALLLWTTFADDGHADFRAAGVAAAASAWTVFGVGVISAYFWITIFCGPEVVERNAESTEARGSWRISLLILGAGVLLIGSPAAIAGDVLFENAGKNLPARVMILAVVFAPALALSFWPFRWSWATSAACSALKTLAALQATDQLRLDKLPRITAPVAPQEGNSLRGRRCWSKHGNQRT